VDLTSIFSLLETKEPYREKCYACDFMYHAPAFFSCVSSKNGIFALFPSDYISHRLRKALGCAKTSRLAVGSCLVDILLRILTRPVK
jgi:hypothetical protein